MSAPSGGTCAASPQAPASTKSPTLIDDQTIAPVDGPETKVS